MIAGEPGIGKTTVLDALATEASRRGGVAIWGRGEPEGRPYGVWRPIVRSLSTLVAGEPDPALAPLLGGAGSAGGEEGRLRLYDAVADLLAAAAAERPLLVVLDDLHWADASSLRLLAHARASGERLLLAGAYTPAEVRFGDLLREIEDDPCAELMELRRARPRGRARAAAGRDPRRAGAQAHGRQPVLRRRARPPPGHRGGDRRRHRARSSPPACARSCAGASSGSGTTPAPCSRSARSRGASRSPTSCAPRACHARRRPRRSTAGPPPAW